MRRWIKGLRGARRPRPARCSLTVERLEDRTVPSTGFVETSLVSDIPGLAAHTYRDLINPWGLTETPQGQFRVAANGAGNAPLITARGNVLGRPVFVQPPPRSPPHTTAAPTG